MKDFVITCTSTCDLSKEYLKENNNHFVNFFYFIEDEKFNDDFYSTHSINDFYEKIKKSNVKTSQPDPEQYKNLWLDLIDKGYDILHIELSSGISGAMNSALIAKSLVEEINPSAKVYVIDSLSASAGYGFLIDLANMQKRNNKSIEEIRDYIENIKLNINHLVIVTNFEQLVKGGRVSKTAGGIGTLLNIFPILHVNNEGKLEVIKKARGLNNAFNEIINLVDTNILNGIEYNNKIFISNSNIYDKAKELYIKITGKYVNNLNDKENIFNIGTVIGSHTGDGTIALFYIGDGRV